MGAVAVLDGSFAMQKSTETWGSAQLQSGAISTRPCRAWRRRSPAIRGAAAAGGGRGLRGGLSRPATTPGLSCNITKIVAQRNDALLREIALDLLAQVRPGHRPVGSPLPPLGIQTGIHYVYVDAHLLRGQQHFKAGRYAEVLADYAACLDYPDRFETGRPRRDEAKAAQVHYFLGTVYEAIHDPAQWRARFSLARRARPGWTRAHYQARPIAS